MLTIRDEAALTSHERAVLGHRPTLANFEHYARHSTTRTQLFFAKVYRGNDFLGLAPVTKLIAYQTTELLHPSRRKWLAPLLGPLARKTTYMIDSAFLAFEYRSLFFCPSNGDEDIVRTAISGHLKRKTDADTIWIAEPARGTSWADEHGYDSFSALPTVQVDLAGRRTLDSYLDALSRKRRRNLRVDHRVFDNAGGALAYYAPPVPPAVLEELHLCLVQSAARSDLTVPYGDLLNDRDAFLSQAQHVLVAAAGGRIAGFFSFIPDGAALLQCHGGFDDERARQVHAYANLINAAIEHAIARGFERVTMGPLNNETKRRAGTHLLPVMVSLWCRDTVARLLMRTFFLRSFQVYTGDAGGGDTPGAAVPDDTVGRA